MVKVAASTFLAASRRHVESANFFRVEVTARGDDVARRSASRWAIRGRSRSSEGSTATTQRGADFDMEKIASGGFDAAARTKIEVAHPRGRGTIRRLGVQEITRRAFNATTSSWEKLTNLLTQLVWWSVIHQITQVDALKLGTRVY